MEIETVQNLRRDKEVQLERRHALKSISSEYCQRKSSGTEMIGHFERSSVDKYHISFRIETVIIVECNSLIDLIV